MLQLIKKLSFVQHFNTFLNSGNGRQIYSPEVRNNDRSIIDDEVLAEKVQFN